MDSSAGWPKAKLKCVLQEMKAINHGWFYLRYTIKGEAGGKERG